MYMTVMTFAIFRLDTWAFLKISIFAGLSYTIAVGLQWTANPLIVDLWQSAFRLLLLQAVMIWGLIYARQLRELRNQLQFRNEELQSMIARVSKIAGQDHLTKSFNRRYIMEAALAPPHFRRHILPFGLTDVACSGVRRGAQSGRARPANTGRGPSCGGAKAAPIKRFDVMLRRFHGQR